MHGFEQNDDYKRLLGAICPYRMARRGPDCSPPRENCLLLFEQIFVKPNEVVPHTTGLARTSVFSWNKGRKRAMSCFEIVNFTEGNLRPICFRAERWLQACLGTHLSSCQGTKRARLLPIQRLPMLFEHRSGAWRPRGRRPDQPSLARTSVFPKRKMRLLVFSKRLVTHRGHKQGNTL